MDIEEMLYKKMQAFYNTPARGKDGAVFLVNLTVPQALFIFTELFMHTLFNRKTFKWISCCVYFLALLGLTSIVFQSPASQPARFQYRSFSPGGLLRTIIDYAQIISLLVLIAHTAMNYQFNKTLAWVSTSVYIVFILVDVNTWLFYINESILYVFIIAVQATPLVIFLYQSHIFKKEWKGVLITGVIALLLGLLSHFSFYHLAVSKGFRSGYYYDYPMLMKLIGWLCFTGALFTIVTATEALSNYLSGKQKQLTLFADSNEPLN